MDPSTVNTMNADESSIPTGDKFLAGTSSNRLKKMQKAEKDPKAAVRLIAYNLRKDGMTIQQIADSLKRSYSTVRNWLVRAVQSGVDGRHSIPQKGAPNKLSPGQQGQLHADLVAGPRACGFESGAWTVPLLMRHVKKKFGVAYARSSMYVVLHRLGFSCRKPRPKHPKSASTRQKNAFKKKVEAVAAANPDHKKFAIDGAWFIAGWNIQYAWYLKGLPISCPISLSRERVYMLGALHSGGFDSEFYGKMDTAAIIDMLSYLHKRYGKSIVVLDNASYHKSAGVKKFVDSLGGDMILMYLPPYTPELNPVEGQWKMFRKATANMLHDSAGAMEKSMLAMLRKGEVKIAKMSSYLS